MLNIKLHSKPVYDEKYIKAKIKTFKEVINIIFWKDEILKESVNYSCIAVISDATVMEIDTTKYRQIYLEEYKYKIKKKEMNRFIEAE